MRKLRDERLLVLGFLFAYLLCNLLFLTRYPIVHSDESWLSGLTRNMMAENSPGVTEPFFDLKPRYPHAVKILFHLLQMPFIAAFGYSVFAVRLLSLVAGVVALWLFYRCGRICAPFPVAFGAMALMSVHGQFIAAAHTARQEILLLCAIFALALVLLECRDDLTRKHGVLLGLIVGLSVGLHPNSFLLAVGCGLAMLLHMAVRRSFRAAPLLCFIGVTGALALVFVGLSFSFDPQFPAHYRLYGQSEFELDVPVTDKFAALGDYLAKLWRGESGTYTLPDLALPLLLCAGLTGFAFWRAFHRRDARAATPLGLTLGALLGTVLIGRYNQLSAALWMLPSLLGLPVLLTPPAAPLTSQYANGSALPIAVRLPVAARQSAIGASPAASATTQNVNGAALPTVAPPSANNPPPVPRCALRHATPRVRALLLTGLAVAMALTSVAPIRAAWPYDYQTYLDSIATYVSPQTKTLANLNAGFYFANGSLLDVRNLTYLQANGLTFAQYVESRGVQAILWPDEMDFLYRRRPDFNALYGNPRYVPEVEAFLQARCTLLGAFDSPGYGTRLVQRIGTPQTVRVYRVNP